METNQIFEENSCEVQNPPLSDGTTLAKTSGIFTCEICQNAITDNRELTELLEEQENVEDYEAVDNKRKELDGIQKDLNSLMVSLNAFVSENREEYESDEDENDDSEEKKDGPQEKELKRMEKYYDNIYTSDGFNPPEVNWSHLAPILQKHVGDLQRLHNLNTLTSSVMQRIKKITQLKDALRELEESQ